MHIGLIIYGSLDTLSGGYLYDRKLVEYLRSQGDKVEIISLPWRNYAAHLTDNFRFHLGSPGASSWQIHQGAGGLHGFDILIQDELNHPSLLLANRGKHLCPIISLVHHLRCSELRPAWQNRFYRFIERKYLQSVDGFIFNSRTTKNVVQALINDGKPSVLAYPPTDRFGAPLSENEIRARAKTDEFRILFLGNVIYRKGLHTLLEAIQKAKSKVRIEVVGSLTSEPVYVKLIQEIIEQNHLSSCVFLHGALDREPLIQKLKQAHVLVVPSSYEGYGIVYLEGMCFGLPAIGTTAGAAGEIIENGKTGFLITPDDSTSLARHIQSLAEDRDLLVRLSLHARARYLRQPAWTVSAKNIRDFLFSLSN
jgi:glycosyltransferase involved in cell wall biosynthesis